MTQPRHRYERDFIVTENPVTVDYALRYVAQLVAEEAPDLPPGRYTVAVIDRGDT